MSEQFENNFATQLNGAINNTDTTLTVDAVPTTMTGSFRIKIEDEIILVGSVSGSTFTGCTRGVEGTTTASHSDNTVVTHVLTAQALRNAAPTAFIGARAYHSTTQSANATDVLFDSEEWDTDGFHSISSNTGRMTIPAGLSGKYQLTAHVREGGGSLHGIRFKKNGSEIIGQVAVGQYSLFNTTIVDAVAGDYFTVYWDDNNTIGSATNYLQNTFEIVKIDSGNTAGLVLLEEHIASSSATLDFTNFVSDAYDEYMLEGMNLIPATNTQALLMRVGTGGTPTYQTGSDYYGAVHSFTNASNTRNVAYNTTAANITGNVTNAGTYGTASFSLRFTNPNNTALNKFWHGTAMYHDGTDASPAVTGGLWNSNTAVTALRFYFASGNITSGTIRVYGISKNGGGTGSITVKDEGSSLSVPASEIDFVGAGVTATGTGQTKTVTIPGNHILLEQHTASSSSSLDFTNFISSTYDDYLIEIVGILPATNAVDLQMQVGTGGGPTYDTTGANYSSQNVGVKNDGTAVAVVQNPGAAIVCSSMSNVVDYGGAQVSLTLRLPQSTTQRRNFTGTGQHVRTTGGLHVLLATIGLQYQTLGTALTAIKFLMSSGNIASGTIRIYGIAK